MIAAQIREKFATQVNSKTLKAIRALAEREGCRLQVLVDEALADLCIASHKKYGPLYKKLAE